MDIGKVKKDITEHWKFVVISFALGLLSYLFITLIYDIELIKFSNKLINLAVVLLAYATAKIYFGYKKVNTDEKIAESPIAIAISIGLFVFSVAIAVSAS